MPTAHRHPVPWLPWSPERFGSRLEGRRSASPQDVRHPQVYVSKCNPGAHGLAARLALACDAAHERRATGGGAAG